MKKTNKNINHVIAMALVLLWQCPVNSQCPNSGSSTQSQSPCTWCSDAGPVAQNEGGGCQYTAATGGGSFFCDCNAGTKCKSSLNYVETYFYSVVGGTCQGGVCNGAWWDGAYRWTLSPTKYSKDCPPPPES